VSVLLPINATTLPFRSNGVHVAPYLCIRLCVSRCPCFLKTLVFDPEAEDRYNVDLLQKVMPEMATYSSEFGGVFRARALPDLKLMVHTGIDKLNCKIFTGFDITLSLCVLRDVLSFSLSFPLWLSTQGSPFTLRVLFS